MVRGLFLPLRPLTLTRSGPARVSGSLGVFLGQDAYSKAVVFDHQRRSIAPHLLWLMYGQERSFSPQDPKSCWRNDLRRAEWGSTPDPQSFSFSGEFHWKLPYPSHYIEEFLHGSSFAAANTAFFSLSWTFQWRQINQTSHSFTDNYSLDW